MAYCAIFLIVLYVIFSKNSACLLYGLDGTSWLLKFQAQSARQAFSQLGVDPLQGSFDAYYAALRENFLPEALSLLLTGTGASKVATYTIYGALMLAAAYMLARSVGFSRAVAALGGALFAAVALPTDLSGVGWIYGIYNLVPHLAQAVSLAIIIVACFWQIRSDRPIAALGLGLIAGAGVVIAAASFITMTLLMIPTIAIYGGASIFASRRRSDILARCLMAVACGAVPLALGMLQYAIAVGGYTAYNFFGQEFQQTRASLAYASILYNPGAIFWILGLLGALYAAIAERGKIRLFAWTHLVATGMFLAMAILVVTFANYHGPSPLYFEFFVWPIMLIFTAFLVAALWEPAIAALRSLWGSFVGPQIAMIDRHGLLAVVPLVLVIWSGVVLLGGGRTSICSTVGFSPIRSTPITERLKEEIATKVNSPFRGLAATFNGVQDKPSLDWGTFHGSDYQLWRSFGNDLRLVGLWRYGIPTLFQYSPLITPPYYLMLTEFLSRPADRQVRSVLVLTVPNDAMLKLWGVRFVITDHELGFGRTRAKIPLPGTEQNFVRLIELSNPNLGDYSPTEVSRVANFREALEVMHQPGYDARRKVVTDEALAGPFVPATGATLIYQKYGFTVSGSSAGRSIMVLPVQYSRCWTASGEGDPALFRANMNQLGIVFTRRLEAKLIFRFGPFYAAGCRIQDIRDMDRLAIRDARKR